MYTAAPHCQLTVSPGVSDRKRPCQVTGPMLPGSPSGGARNARPLTKTFLSKLAGDTVVNQVSVAAS